MKGSRAHRIKIGVGDLWESPILHILLTREEDVVVARCLDFTVSAHGKNEKVPEEIIQVCHQRKHSEIICRNKLRAS